jgi:hypothetical protein
MRRTHRCGAISKPSAPAAPRPAAPPASAAHDDVAGRHAELDAVVGPEREVQRRAPSPPCPLARMADPGFVMGGSVLVLELGVAAAALAAGVARR